MRDLYQDVTNRIVAELEKGVKPWAAPWRKSAPAIASLPVNYATGRNYNGTNTLMLWLEAYEKGYPSHGWLTFKQALDMGGYVRKGERSTPVIYVSMKERERDDGTTDTYPVARSYAVFNVAQVEGLTDTGVQLEPPPDRFSKLAAIKHASGIPVSHGHMRACYIPSQDRIEMPAFDAFPEWPAYWRTLYHEMSHATGHPSRLNRQMGKRFGDAAYAAEELVAELSSAFLCARTGMPYANENAEYIGAWVRLMKSDSKAIFTAASAASASADWLYDRSLEKEPELEHSL